MVLSVQQYRCISLDQFQNRRMRAPCDQLGSDPFFFFGRNGIANDYEIEIPLLANFLNVPEVTGCGYVISSSLQLNSSRFRRLRILGNHKSFILEVLVTDCLDADLKSGRMSGQVFGVNRRVGCVLAFGTRKKTVNFA